jgi:putative transposase
MAKTEHYYTKFEEESFYHVYNRTVDKKPMFKNDGNYEYFLKQYDKYLSSVVDTYSYCLLGNHFHLFIKVRNLQDLTTFKKLSNLPLSNPNKQNLQDQKSVHHIVSDQFRKFFQSYSMSFNKQQQRIGTLFQTPFKRVLVERDDYFTNLVYYIHANPQLHKLIHDFRNWKWSSYKRFLIEKPSKLKKMEVLDWFGGMNRYLQYHKGEHESILGDVRLEDD